MCSHEPGRNKSFFTRKNTVNYNEYASVQQRVKAVAKIQTSLIFTTNVFPQNENIYMNNGVKKRVNIV